MAEGMNVTEELRAIYESDLSIPISTAVSPLPRTPKKRIARSPKSKSARKSSTPTNSPKKTSCASSPDPLPGRSKVRGKSMSYLLELKKKKEEKSLSWEDLRDVWIRESPYPVKFFDKARKAINFEAVKVEMGFERFSLKGKNKLLSFMVTYLVNVVQRCIIIADNSTLQDDFYSLQWLPKNFEGLTLRSKKKIAEDLTLVSLPAVERKVKTVSEDVVRCALESADHAEFAPRVANYVLIAGGDTNMIQIEKFPDQLMYDLYGWVRKTKNKAAESKNDEEEGEEKAGTRRVILYDEERMDTAERDEDDSEDDENYVTDSEEDCEEEREHSDTGSDKEN